MLQCEIIFVGKISFHKILYNGAQQKILQKLLFSLELMLVKLVKFTALANFVIDLITGTHNNTCNKRFCKRK